MDKAGNNFKKINNESVVQQIIQSLTDAMIAHELRPGDRIPTECELAEALGVGRNSVREAIKILVYLGVLEIRRAQGTFVCEGFSESMIDPMIYGIILDKEDSYENLIELRELMEVGVMRLAMKKLTPEKIDELEKCLDAMRKEVAKGPENFEAVFLVDNAFHDEISHMGENPLVDKINQVVRLLTHAMRFQTVKNILESGNEKEFLEAHEKLFRMMKTEDMENMNEAVRKTYFTDKAFKNGDETAAPAQ